MFQTDLGPQFVYEALRTDVLASEAARGRSLRFLANVDPADAAAVLHGLDAEETLVVVVSKTFTTAETMLNARTVKAWLINKLKGKAKESDVVAKHMVAVRYDTNPTFLCVIGYSAMEELLFYLPSYIINCFSSFFVQYGHSKSCAIWNSRKQYIRLLVSPKMLPII